MYSHFHGEFALARARPPAARVRQGAFMERRGRGHIFPLFHLLFCVSINVYLDQGKKSGPSYCKTKKNFFASVGSKFSLPMPVAIGVFPMRAELCGRSRGGGDRPFPVLAEAARGDARSPRPPRPLPGGSWLSGGLFPKGDEGLEEESHLLGV